jgi:hypothetical protein
MLQAAASRYAQSNSSEVDRLSRLHSDVSASSGSNTSNHRLDLVLMAVKEWESPTEQPQQHSTVAEQQPGTQPPVALQQSVQQQLPATLQREPRANQLMLGRPMAVGELKKPPFLMSQAADGSSQPLDLIDGYYKKDAKALHVIGQVCMPWCARLLRSLIKHQAYHCVAACIVLNQTFVESLALSMGLFLFAEGVLYLAGAVFYLRAMVIID